MASQANNCDESNDFLTSHSKLVQIFYMYSSSFVNWELGYSLWGSAIDVILLLALLLISQKGLSKKRRNKNPIILWILLLLFCVFAYWSGDFYHYYHYFDTFRFDFRYLTGIEAVELPYWYIADFVNYSYSFLPKV